MTTLLPATVGDRGLIQERNSRVECVSGQTSQAFAFYEDDTVLALCLYSNHEQAERDRTSTTQFLLNEGFEVEKDEQSLFSDDGSRVGTAVLFKNPNAEPDKFAEQLLWTNGPLSGIVASNKVDVALDFFSDLPY